MQILWLAVLMLFQSSPSLRGRVIDGRTGEPVGRARVALNETKQVVETSENGDFELAGSVNQELTLYVTAVGYAVTRKIVSAANSAQPVEVVLVPEGAAHSEQITVTTTPFEGADPIAPSQYVLSKSELQASALVLVGDPLRSAQALPGIVANNDLRADFSVRGAGFDRVAVYVDGVLTDNFVHTFVLADDNERISLSVINQDTVGGLSVMPGAYPSNYGDSTAAVTILDTREGNRVRPTGRFGTGIIATSGVLDGPFAGKRGAWLASVRTSYADYLQQLVTRITSDNDNRDDAQLNFSDASFKVNYDVSPASSVGLSSTFGTFGGNQGNKSRLESKDNPDANDTFESKNVLLNAHWRYAPNSAFLGTVRTFLIRGRYSVKNLDRLTLDGKDKTQYGLRFDAGMQVGRSHHVDAGFYGRVMQAKKVSSSFLFVPALVFERYDRQASEDSYYLQDTWNSERLRLSLTGGGRLEHNNLTHQTLVSPRAGLTLGLPAHLVVRAGAGVYRQIPDFDAVFGFFGNPDLRAEKATHFNASVERLFGARTRLVAEAYDREEQGLVFSLSEPRFDRSGEITIEANPFRNSLRGHARGVEVTLQRRSANGLTGWASYAYSRSWLRETSSGLGFVSDVDQRHTVNLFGSYRMGPTFSVSTQARYGSGQPLPGFLKRVGSTIELATERNADRLHNYLRLDVRPSKSFPHATWKWTLSGEILNVLNHRNEYNINSNIVRFRSTGQYQVGVGQSFGRGVAVGVYFEF